MNSNLVLSSTVAQMSIDFLRQRNAELLDELATAQEFIAQFPGKVAEIRRDCREGKPSKYDFRTHSEILHMEGGPSAIRSSLREGAGA